MAYISDELLRKEIIAILKDADLSITSAKNVRMELEEKFNVNLLSRRLEIDKLCMEFVNAKDYQDKEEVEEEYPAESNEKQNIFSKAFLNNSNISSVSTKKVRPVLQEKHSANLQTRNKEIDDLVREFASEDCGEKDDSENNKRKNIFCTDDESEDSDIDWAKSEKTNEDACDITRGKGSVYVKPMTLSPELAALVGQNSMTRHEVVKKIWAIIKEKNLYDPKYKQYAICDDALMKVIGVKRFRTFHIMKYLRNHFIS